MSEIPPDHITIPERKSFTGMHFSRATWALVVVVSLAFAFLVGQHEDGVQAFGMTIGGALGILLFPLLVLGLVVVVGRAFKVPPGRSTRRAIFFVLWGLMVLGQLPQFAMRERGTSKKTFMASCERSAREQATFNIDSMLDVRAYCECAYQKMLERPRGLQELQGIKDRNSVVHNELAMPCVQAAMKEQPIGMGSVRGMQPSDTVPVLNSDQGYKVKVTLGGEEVYFLFDSGASDCFVSASMEEKMKRSGAIQGYLDNMSYEMANGELIDCRRAIVNNIGIGGFVVDSAVVAVCDSEIQFLLGKSLMDKFTSWHFANGGTGLVLVK